MIHRILQGDVIKALAALPDGSVQCVITSPPYWGLRDYSLCDCFTGGEEIMEEVPGEWFLREARAEPKFTERKPDPNCPECGGTGKIKVMEGQIGLEPSPEEYVKKMVGIFREIRRVLREDGTVWLNIGDCYATGGGFGGQGTTGVIYRSKLSDRQGRGPLTEGFKPKDLVAIPWRLALALQGDGWFLRSDIIWSKPNPMPESIIDRPTKAHEYIFLLAKAERYFYDQEAIRERGAIAAGTLAAKGSRERAAIPGVNARPPEYKEYSGYRNRRTVWVIPTQAFPGAHFATFPEALVEPCIKAGTSSRGACPACGAPWARVVEVRDPEGRLGKGYHDHVDDLVQGQRGVFAAEGRPEKITVGWAPSCRCDPGKKQDALGKRTYTGFNDRWKKAGGKAKAKGQRSAPSCECEAGEPVPCVVLDPFGGSGTVAKVARDLGRSSISIELNPTYVEMIRGRLRVGEELDEAIRYEVVVLE